MRKTLNKSLKKIKKNSKSQKGGSKNSKSVSKKRSNATNTRKYRKITKGGANKFFDAPSEEWELEHTLSGHKKSTAANWSPVNTVAVFRDDSNRVVSGSADKTIKIWDANTEKLLHTLSDTKLEEAHPSLTQPSHENQVLAVAVFKDGRVVSGSSDKTIKIWDANTGDLLRTLSDPLLAHLRGGRGASHAGSVLTVAVFQDGSNRVVSGSYDNKVKIWDANNGELLQTLSGHEDIKGYVSAVSVFADGKKIVVGSSIDPHKYTLGNTDKSIKYRKGHDKGMVKIWSTESWKELPTSSEMFGTGTCLVPFPDGERVMSGSDDLAGQAGRGVGGKGIVKIWDANSGEELHTLSGHTGIITAGALFPDGERVLSGSTDETIKIWNLKSGKINTLSTDGQTALPGFTSRPDAHKVYAADVFTDGKRIVSGGMDGNIRIWKETKYVLTERARTMLERGTMKVPGLSNYNASRVQTILGEKYGIGLLKSLRPTRTELNNAQTKKRNTPRSASSKRSKKNQSK